MNITGYTIFDAYIVVVAAIALTIILYKNNDRI